MKRWRGAKKLVVLSALLTVASLSVNIIIGNQAQAIEPQNCAAQDESVYTSGILIKNDLIKTQEECLDSKYCDFGKNLPPSPSESSTSSSPTSSYVLNCSAAYTAWGKSLSANECKDLDKKAIDKKKKDNNYQKAKACSANPNQWCKLGDKQADCTKAINEMSRAEHNVTSNPYISRICSGMSDSAIAGDKGETEFDLCAKDVTSGYDTCSKDADPANCMFEKFKGKYALQGKSDDDAKKLIAEAQAEASGNLDAINACKQDASKCEDEWTCETYAGGVWDESKDPKCQKPASGDAAASDSDQEKCQKAVKGFGWILCPGVDLLSETLTRISEGIGQMLQWRLLAEHPDATYSSWKSFVNIANIAFAIAFLIMIYSMATGASFASFSNYTIKKMLPRLIVVAIAVNLSFYICAALADLFNVAGQGIYNIIVGTMTCGDGSDDCHSIGSFFGAFAKGLVSILAMGAGIIIAIFAFGGTVLIGFLMILLLVMMRNVFLTVLVIVSPVAIVLYLLPNTQKWAQKWSDMYVRSLLVYPMFMAVIGASQIVSNIMDNEDMVMLPILAQLIPGLLAMIPLFAIIPIIRMSNSIMGQFAGAMQGLNKRLDMSGRGNRLMRRSQPVRWANDKVFNGQQRMSRSRNPFVRRIGGVIGNSAIFAAAATSGYSAKKDNDDKLEKLYDAQLTGLSNQELLRIAGGASQPVAIRQAAMKKIDGKTLSRDELAGMRGIARSMKVDKARGIGQRDVTAFASTAASKVADADDSWYGKYYASMIRSDANPNINGHWNGSQDETELGIAINYAKKSSPKSLIDSNPQVVQNATGILSRAAERGDIHALSALANLQQNAVNAQSLSGYKNASIDAQRNIQATASFRPNLTRASNQLSQDYRRAVTNGEDTRAMAVALASSNFYPDLPKDVREGTSYDAANDHSTFSSLNDVARQRVAADAISSSNLFQSLSSEAQREIADTAVSDGGMFSSLSSDEKQRAFNGSTASSVIAGFNRAVDDGDASQISNYAEQANTLLRQSTSMTPEVKNALRQATRNAGIAMPSKVAMPSFINQPQPTQVPLPPRPSAGQTGPQPQPTDERWRNP